MKLNMGCGKDFLPGYINADLRSLPGVDVAHDLNRLSYPFKDNAFDEIYCNNILEHLDDIVHTMEEMHRIGKPKCHIIIRSPHFSSQYAFMDPTHKHYFGHESFDYFLEDTKGRFPDFYTNAKFRLISRKIIFSKGKLLLYNYFMEWLANKIPQFYEGTFLRVFPAEQMMIVLEVSK